MKSFDGDATISATPDGIWAILTDVGHCLLVSMMWRSMPDLGRSFARFANLLKERAERPG